MRPETWVGSINVRFTPNSGHWQRTSRCPLCANSGHSAIHSIQGNADCCRLLMGQLMRGGLPFLGFVVFG